MSVIIPCNKLFKIYVRQINIIASHLFDMLAANLYPTRAQSFPLAKILGTRLEVSCNQLNFFLSIRSGLHGYLLIVTSEQPGTIYWLPTGSTSHSMWIDLLLIYPIYRKRSGVFYFRFSITDELKQIRQPQPYPPQSPSECIDVNDIIIC